MFIDIIAAPLDDFWPGVFVLGMGGNMRPPRGLPGLVDWRLGGSISSMIIDGGLEGELDENILFWSDRRKSKIYIYGMGKRIPPAPETVKKLSQRILDSLVKAGETQVVLIPDPLLTGSGDKGLEGFFLEGLVESVSHSEGKADDFRFIVPCQVKKAEEVHEAFRRAILRIGNKAEGVKLSIIEGQFALHV